MSKTKAKRKDGVVQRDGLMAKSSSGSMSCPANMKAKSKKKACPIATTDLCSDVCLYGGRCKPIEAYEQGTKDTEKKLKRICDDKGNFLSFGGHCAVFTRQELELEHKIRKQTLEEVLKEFEKLCEKLNERMPKYFTEDWKKGFHNALFTLNGKLEQKLKELSK